MKTIRQIVTILVVSFLVVGATYGVSQTGWAAQQGFGRRPPGREEFRPSETGGEAGPAVQNSQTAPRRTRGGPGGRPPEGFSIFGILSFLPVLLPMVLMIGGVSLFKRWRFGKSHHG